MLADEAYGSDSKFRRFLESKKQPYVVCIRGDLRLWTRSAGRQRIDATIADKPVSGWFRHSVGDGAKGPRLYDWTAQRFGQPTEDGLIHWLLARRNIEKPDEIAYYFCLAPADTTKPGLAVAAGQRWAIECCFETAKQETGLDEYEVRSWHGWYRHITLSMLATAFLAVLRSEAHAARLNAEHQKGATH